MTVDCYVFQEILRQRRQLVKPRAAAATELIDLRLLLVQSLSLSRPYSMTRGRRSRRLTLSSPRPKPSDLHVLADAFQPKRVLAGLGPEVQQMKLDVGDLVAIEVDRTAELHAVEIRLIAAVVGGGRAVEHQPQRLLLLHFQRDLHPGVLRRFVGRVEHLRLQIELVQLLLPRLAGSVMLVVDEIVVRQRVTRSRLGSVRSRAWGARAVNVGVPV